MNNKISILHLRSTLSPQSIGGADKIIWNIAKFIDKECFSCLLCFLTKKKTRTLSSQPVQDRDVKYYVLPCRRFIDLAQLLALLKNIKKNKIKIIHSHDYKANIFGLLIKLILPQLKLGTTI